MTGWSPRDTLDAAARVAELSQREAGTARQVAEIPRAAPEPPKPPEPAPELTLAEVREALRELDAMAAGPGTAELRDALVALEAAVAEREAKPRKPAGRKRARK